ncbi:hypothetical protein GCM10027280_31870 [Micromonospora polyrhachis]
MLGRCQEVLECVVEMLPSAPSCGDRAEDRGVTASPSSLGELRGDDSDVVADPGDDRGVKVVSR